ncbi:MAG TPA: serine hydrolase domain-containing protein, partial [Planctomycetota bacterium]|nr:serine hydrolase domain-containing protein [Planctomycetota bacterium]
MHPPTESLLLRRSLGIALLALAAFLPSCRSREIERAAPAELGLSEEKLAELRADISTLVEEERIPGAAMLVVRDGKLAWLDTVGFANVAREEPLAGDSIFRICSMTKPVTSVAAMILVEEGKLALDDPVSRYIPEFANVEVGVPEESDGATVVKTVPLEQPLTVRHLLTHTSGLTYTFMGNGWINQAYREAGVNDGLVEAEGTCADNVRKLATVPLLFQPGSRWNYGLSTDVLGRVVEVASGRTLEQFFEERIFSPLGMRDTHFRLPRGKRDRLVSAYQPRSDDDPRIVPLPDGPVRRGGALYSATYPLSGSEHFSGGAGLVSSIT